MASEAFLLLAAFLAILLIVAQPLGHLLTSLALDRPLPGTVMLERGIARLCGIQNSEMNWRQFLSSLLLFNLIGLLFLFIVLMLQGVLPLNPQRLPGLSWHLALNTAISFVTNTNWQSYAGESTMSYFSETVGLTVQNFLSAATGITMLFALMRGFSRHSSDKLGNAWRDLTRITLFVLLPLSLLMALFFISQGTIQNFTPYVTATTLEGARQTLPMGPVASQEAIKMPGTNGGGLFNANSAHPFENPTALTNFVQMLAIFAIPAALCFTFGNVVRERAQGRAILWAMSLLFVLAAVLVMMAEVRGNPHLRAFGADSAMNWEGKESRFGILNSSLFAVITTAASCGAVNAMHDCFTALGGLIPLWLIQLGEVVFGSVGSGLYGMLMNVLLALRRTADRVDDQMRAWRDMRGREEKVWHTRDAILLCIGANSGSEKLVRIAARLASRLGCEWHAVTVETPTLYRQRESRRRTILRTLQLAQNMGATTATLSDPDEAQAVVRYAREHNLGKIIVGRPPQRRWRFTHRFTHNLSRLAPDLDLMIVALDDAPDITTGQEAAARSGKEIWRQKLRGCLAAAALCALITLSVKALLPGFSPINLIMIYLLGVVLIAIGFGRLPSVVAALLNIVAFDLFFIAPVGSFAVMDARYLVTFAVMLAVGVITGYLTAGGRYQARVARHREQRARYLYEMAEGLSRARQPEEVAQISQRVVGAALLARCEVWLPDNQEAMIAPRERMLSTVPDPAIVKWSFDKRQVAGAGTDTLPGVLYKILPLTSSDRALGLLIIEPGNLRHLLIPEQQRLLDTFAVLISDARSLGGRFRLCVSGESDPYADAEHHPSGQQYAGYGAYRDGWLPAANGLGCA